METNKVLNVFFKNIKVGTLAITKEKTVGFEYDDEWIKTGFSISPFSLPLKKQLFICNKPYFNGLFGVFADSLPDAWGNLLLNRMLKDNKIDIENMNILDRLAIVGSSGMGALEYKPSFNSNIINENINLDKLAMECKKILESSPCNSLEQLYFLGGSSGGARPKILVNFNNEDWIIKFNSHLDDQNSGKIEFDYYLCAKKCGIDMMDSKLFPSKTNSGYFGTKRFDRLNNNKQHMISVAALLELDFNTPSMDYHILMKLIKIITNNNYYDIRQMFKRMCFNVFAHNRDDHSKNFSFIYNEQEKTYRLSPAYDLIYSNTYFGEHTTTIDGNGKNPSEKELLKVGVSAGLSKKECLETLNNIKKIVFEDLNVYLNN